MTLALALALPNGAPAAQSVSQAAALAIRGPSQPPPAPEPGDPQSELALQLQGVWFPNWSASFGWRAIGQRSDSLDGRPTATIFYVWHRKRIAYTIVGVGGSNPGHSTKRSIFMLL